MSSVHIPRAMSQRGRSALDIERENFEKTQMTSLQKAINSQETPVKEKHARRAIMGSHQDHGAGLFWSIVLRFQLQGNPIICWKFCNVLHKIMRDGHANSIPESYRYCGFLTDLGKLWGHLKDHHGRLIAHYTKLLVQKLSFHKKYPDIPGSLTVSDDQLDKICNKDINAYFEMSVDLLDYMDDILALQAAVFGSLDMSRANSMTAVGQCRLSPLIPCIQDSCQLYDALVKILFKLHSSLPPDTLTGHRDRFYKQYKNLKRFYFNSGNLQYFKNLIRVPVLPDEAPNFLIASELSSHVKPEAVVEEPEPEPEPEDAPVDLLVDTVAAVQENGAPSPPMPDEKDIMIQQLIAEVTRLREEIGRLRGEEQMMAESLHNRIRELDMEITELKQIAESTQEENEDLRNVMKAGEKDKDAAARLAAMEKIATTNEDKFKKIRDMYTRIKKEHVELLRTHADSTKALAIEKRQSDTLEEEKKSLQQEIQELSHEKSAVETNFQQCSSENAAELTAINSVREQLELHKQSLEENLQEVTSQRDQKEAECQDVTEKQQQALSKIETLEAQIEQMKTDKQTVDESFSSEQDKHTEAVNKIQRLETELQEMTSDRDATQADCENLRVEKRQTAEKIESLESELEREKSEKRQTEEAHQETQNQHTDALSKISELEKLLDERTKCLSESRRECQDLLEQKEKSAARIEVLESDLETVHTAKDSTEAQRQTVVEQRENARNEIKLLKGQLEETVGEREESRSESAELHENLSQAKNTIQALTSNLESVTAEKEQTESALTELTKNHDDAVIAIKSLGGSLEETVQQRDVSKAECSALQQKHGAAIAKIQSLEGELRSETEEKSKVKVALANLEKNYKNIVAEKQQLTKDFEMAQSKGNNLTSELENMTKSRDEMNNKNTELDNQLSALEAAKTALQGSLTQSQANLDQIQKALEQTKTDKETSEKTHKQEMIDYRKKILMSAVEEGEVIMRDSLSQLDNSHLSSLTCTAEYLMERVNPLLQTITCLRDSVSSYSQNPDELEDLVKAIVEFSHRMGDAVVMGFATAQSASIEEGEALTGECKLCGETSLVLLKSVKSESFEKVPLDSEQVCDMVNAILERAEALLPKVEDIKAEQMGDLVDQEMQQTTDAIEKAAAKISAMLAQSREKFTGIQLQVNESILDSCNGLMRAIMKLVDKSKTLQREIVSQGRGASSAKDFYKKHHRWTEGLISAAKAVGWGANVLVDAADRTIRGEAKFEELMVCSQEIAASTTQLVVSSKVKAERGSGNLVALADASKAVTQCTAQVVASAKSGADAIEEIDAMDFSKLTLHQSKRLEMESQVKVLTLESDLEKERRRLGELRKTHYALAGESEGWDQEKS